MKNTLQLLFIPLSILLCGNATAQTDTSDIDTLGLALPSFLAPLEAPTGVRATDSAVFRISVNWNKVANARKYFVYRGLSNEAKAMSLTGLKEGYASSGMADGDEIIPETLYYYRIRAANENNQKGKWSGYDTGFLKGVAFNIIPSLIAPKGNLPEVELVKFAWASIAEVSGYRLQIVRQDYTTWNKNSGYSTNNFMVLDTVVTTNELTLFLSSSLSTDYAWTVQALKGDEVSPFAYYQAFTFVEDEDDILTNGSFSNVNVKRVELGNNTLKSSEYFYAQTLLSNEGPSNAQNIKLSLFLSKDREIDASDSKLGQLEWAGLNLYSFLKITPVKRVPAGLPSGEYYLIVQAEEDNLVGESFVVEVVVE